MAVVAVAAAHLLDATAWHAWRDEQVNDRDWGRMLRSMGYLPVWGVVALSVWLHDRRRMVAKRRALLLVGVPAVAGLVAELSKLMVRRLRPDAEHFGYSFRAFADGPWSNRGMGMPSSHAMVAFAGAAVLARLFPESRGLWYVLAIGCAATRVLSLGHFLSDTVTGAFVGVLVAWAVMHRWPPEEP